MRTSKNRSDNSVQIKTVSKMNPTPFRRKPGKTWNRRDFPSFPSQSDRTWKEESPKRVSRVFSKAVEDIMENNFPAAVEGIMENNNQSSNKKGDYKETKQRGYFVLVTLGTHPMQRHIAQ